MKSKKTKHEFVKLSRTEFVKMFLQRKEEPVIPFLEKKFHEWGSEEATRKKHLKW